MTVTETLLKCTTRHVRLFTAKVENDNLLADPDHLTLDLDPDNEFIWSEEALKKLKLKANLNSPSIRVDIYCKSLDHTSLFHHVFLPLKYTHLENLILKMIILNE